MNKKTALILCLVVLFALGGIYAAMVLKDKGSEEEETDPALEAAGDIVVTDIDQTTIMFLSYTTASGNTLDFEYTVLGWKLKGDEDYPIDNYLVEEMVEMLCSVRSDRLLSEDSSSFAEYGLDPANISATMTDSSGNTYSFRIGDKHPTTSKYYFNVEGEDKVYTVPTMVGRAFEGYETPASLIALPSFPSASPSSVTSFTVEYDNALYEIVYLEDGHSSCYTSDYKWFLKQNGQYLPLDTDKITSLLSTYETMGFDHGEDFSSDPEVLDKYGLKDGYVKVSISYESASEGPVTDSFYVGKGKEDGYGYARLEGSDIIGAIVNKYDFFRFDYENYKPDDFFALTLDSVDSMTMLYGEDRYVVKIDRQTETNESGEEEVTSIYTFNGSEIVGDKVISFFNTIRETQPEGTVSHALGQKVLEISFDLNRQGFDSMTLTFKEYDTNFYTAEFNGSVFLINKQDMQSIESAMLSALGLS